MPAIGVYTLAGIMIQSLTKASHQSSMYTTQLGSVICVMCQSLLIFYFMQNQVFMRGINFRVYRPYILSHSALQWRHNERDGVSNHRRLDCLLKRLFRRRSKKTSKLPVTGLCEGNSPVTGEFPAQRASNAENVSIWWRHHDALYKFAHWVLNKIANVL